MYCNHSCHRCPHCNKCFTRNWYLKKHMKIQHPGPKTSEISENEDHDKRTEDEEPSLTGDRNLKSLSEDGVKELSPKQRLGHGCKHLGHSFKHCNKWFTRGDNLRRHMRIHDRPYQRQNMTSEKISENEDNLIIEDLSRCKSEEGNKELFSLIQRLEDEVKKKFDQLNDGLKKQRDNKIKNLGEIKQDIETLIKTCTTDIVMN